MWITIYYLFSYVIFFYTILAMVCMLLLAIASVRAQRRKDINVPDDDTIRYFLKGSPLTPKVSLIASAYNEELTVVDNVHSMLNIYYPKFDIIIVNDESTDKTMELLIDEFKLVEIPYTNTYKVPSNPIKQVYRSSIHTNLYVIDKAHGGRKSDGINAGINFTDADYFINTDVDCIVEPMAVYRMMWHVVNSHDTMIGVSATMLMSNGCKIEEGRITEPAVSWNPFPWFQQLEYMRSFLLGKLGWSAINTLPNISGGFGLFNTDVVVKSGGYDQLSMAEDVDVLLRMVTYMTNTGQTFKVAQVPEVCCWTEGPFSFRTIYRQRKRWGRGMCEIIAHHGSLFFNPHFKRYGLLTLPYIFLFEFIAPILEAGGFIFMIWLVLASKVNWTTAFVVFGMIYVFSVLITFLTLIFDHSTKAVKWKNTGLAYIKLAIAGIVEPFLYHPIITVCTLSGYINFLRQRTAVWKQITRRGFGKHKTDDSKENTPDTPDGEASASAPGNAAAAGFAASAAGFAAAAASASEKLDNEQPRNDEQPRDDEQAPETGETEDNESHQNEDQQD